MKENFAPIFQNKMVLKQSYNLISPLVCLPLFGLKLSTFFRAICRVLNTWYEPCERKQLKSCSYGLFVEIFYVCSHLLSVLRPIKARCIVFRILTRPVDLQKNTLLKFGKTWYINIIIITQIMFFYAYTSSSYFPIYFYTLISFQCNMPVHKNVSYSLMLAY